MRALRLFATLACLMLMLYLCAPSSALFWSSNFTFPASRYTPAPVPGTPTPTPTATPTSGLPQAITAMMGDVGNGSTNPIPTLCAASSVSVSNGGSTSGNCTSGGSVSVAGIPTNGTDAGSAMGTALSNGDINLPAATYTFTTSVSIPSWRTIQCQPGAILTTASTSLTIFTLGSQDTIVGCTFTGPGSGTGHAITQSSGQNDNILGNVFSSWTSGNALKVTGGTMDVIELNQFDNSGLSTSGGTHIMTAFNEQGGTISPAIPAITNSGGTQRQRDLWTALAALGASGTAAANGYNVVSPGSSFGGHTCTMNGSTDDTACINSALTGSTNGILVAPGTGGNPYVTIGTSDSVTGSQLSGKNILCEPGARFYYPGNSGTGGSPLHMFNMWSVAGSNFNFVGCQVYGDYTDPTVYLAGGRYNEMVEIGNVGSSGNINGLGLDMEDCYGDCWITYAGNSSPTSGPNDIALLFSNLFQGNQPLMHMNGGQGVHNVFDRLGDDDSGDEVDVPTLQTEVAEWDNIYFYSINGVLNNINDVWRQGQISCSDRQNAGANEGGCYAHDILADGALTQSPGVSGSGPWYPTIGVFLGLNAGCTPGNYSGMQFKNGGFRASDDGC